MNFVSVFFMKQKKGSKYLKCFKYEIKNCGIKETNFSTQNKV